MEFKDLQNVVSYYEESIFPAFLDYYKKYYWDLSERKQYIKDWQANEPAKILARIVDTFWSRIYDNQFRFYVSPNRQKDVQTAKAVQNLLVWAIQVSNLKRKFFNSAKDALITWEGYGRVKYTIKKDKVSYFNPKSGKKEFYIKNVEYPDYVYISPFNIMVDPTAQGFESARYVVARRLMTEDQIKKEYSVLTGEIKWLEKLKDEEVAQYLYTTDWLALKNQALYNSSVSDPVTDDTVQFDPNKYFEVIEYWEADRLIIWVNWYKIYDWENPLPIKTLPFIQITYNQEPWTPRWIGLWFQLKHIEEVWTAVINAFLDDMKLKTTPVYKKRIWLNTIKWLNTELDIEPGMTIPVEDPNDLLVMELGRLNYDLQNMYQFLLNEAMMIAGVNDIVMWWPLMKVDRSATSSAGRIESFKARTLNFFDSINQSLWKIAELWLGMIIAYNQGKKFEYKIFDEQQKKTIFQNIKLEDIEWQFDVIFDTQQLKSAMRDVALQKKLNFLQVAAQLAVDPVTQQPIVNLKKLVEKIWYDLDLPDVLYENKEEPKRKTKLQQPIQNQEKPQVQEQPQSQPQQENTEQLVNQLINAVNEWVEEPVENPNPEDAQIQQQLLATALNANAW